MGYKNYNKSKGQAFACDPKNYPLIPTIVQAPLDPPDPMTLMTVPFDPIRKLWITVPLLPVIQLGKLTINPV